MSLLERCIEISVELKCGEVSWVEVALLINRAARLDADDLIAFVRGLDVQLPPPSIP